MRNHMNCSNPWTVLSSFSLVSRTLTITSTHSLCLCRICKQHVFQFDDYVAFAATLYVIQHRRAFVTLSTIYNECGACSESSSSPFRSVYGNFPRAPSQSAGDLSEMALVIVCLCWVIFSGRWPAAALWPLVRVYILEKRGWFPGTGLSVPTILSC